MLNVLPPELKQQIKYARRNVTARRYILIILLIMVVTGNVLVVSHWYADQQIADYEATLQEKNEEMEQYAQLEESVKELNDQIGTMDTLLQQKSRFSVLLTDLAQVLPQNSYLNGLSLTEKVDKPLQLTITSPSKDQAVRVREALLQSPRIDSADIQSISETTEGSEVNVDIVIAFKAEDSS